MRFAGFGQKTGECLFYVFLLIGGFFSNCFILGDWLFVSLKKKTFIYLLFNKLSNYFTGVRMYACGSGKTGK